jgi:hypothetical protein
MPLRSPGAAPYAPPAAVMEVVNGYRQRGLTTPFTTEVLVRAGVSESLVPRTLKSLEVLELIDKEGKPTAQFDLLRRATSEEFQPRMAEFVRGIYGEVFQFTDPATDTPERIADAFRAYDPIGQRGRMVTLFVGLCEAAGIIGEGAARKQAPSGNGKKSPAKPNASSRPARSASFSAKASIRNDTGGTIPPQLMGLMESIPSGGWTQPQRDRFLKAFEYVLDFTVPIVEPRAALAEVTEGNNVG